MSKEYLLTFNQIIENINKFELGTIIESENGQRYKLTKTDNDYKKFSRIDRGLRFMTYDNIHKKFKIIEQQQDLDIQSIKEFDRDKAREEIFTYTESNGGKSNLYCFSLFTESCIIPKINELVQAVKQLDKKI